MRNSRQLLLPVLLAMAVPVFAQTYLPSGKLGPAEKMIIRGVDAQGRTIYSDHVVDGTKVDKTFRQQTFTTTAAPLLAPTVPAKPATAASAPQLTQQQIDANNKKIEEGNIAVAKKNCDTARRQIALLDSGKRVAETNEKGEAVTLDEAAKQQQKQDFNAVIAQNCQAG